MTDDDDDERSSCVTRAVRSTHEIRARGADAGAVRRRARARADDADDADDADVRARAHVHRREILLLPRRVSRVDVMCIPSALERFVFSVYPSSRSVRPETRRQHPASARESRTRRLARLRARVRLDATRRDAMTSTSTSTRYDVLQNGVDAPVGDSSWTTTMGASGARSGANGGDDASDDADARARAMRRDPRWATRAAEAYDGEVGERGRDVCRLLDELKVSQNETLEKIRAAERAATWAMTVEGAKLTMEKLPEYVVKAKNASRRMVELRERLERVEERVSKFS